MSEIKLNIQWLSPMEITPYAKNAKKHPPEQIDQIAAQIAAFGFDQPIVVDKQKIIIKGHGRREASLKLGLEKVPVIVADHLDEYQVMAARIADNKITENHGGYDLEFLRADLGTLQLQQFNVELTGFEQNVVLEILQPVTANEMFNEEDRVSAKEKKEAFEQSDFRQIVLIADPQTFEKLMFKFRELQEKFGVSSQVEVVERLMELYESNQFNT